MTVPPVAARLQTGHLRLQLDPLFHRSLVSQLRPADGTDPVGERLTRDAGLRARPQQHEHLFAEATNVGPFLENQQCLRARDRGPGGSADRKAETKPTGAREPEAAPSPRGARPCRPYGDRRTRGRSLDPCTRREPPDPGHSRRRRSSFLDATRSFARKVVRPGESHELA